MELSKGERVGQEGARQGDLSSPRARFEGRFELVYREYEPRIRGLLRQKVADPELVEDLVQETFLRAYRAFDGYDSRRPLWPWLSTIASRAAMNALSKKARAAECPTESPGPEVEEDLCAVPDDGAYERYLAGERRRGISDALAGLNSRHRRLLLLQALEGWPYEDIADFEGVSTPAVKSVLARARRSFRDAYEQVAADRGLNVALWPLLGWIVSRLRKGTVRLRTRMANAMSPHLGPLPESLAGQTALAVLAGALVLGSATASNSGPATAEDSVKEEPAIRTVGSSGAMTDLGDGSAVGPDPATADGSKEVAAVAEGPEETGIEAGASGRAEQGHLTAKIWTKTPEVEAGPADAGGDDKAPVAEGHVEVDCEKNEVRHRSCNTVDELPDDG